MRTRPAKLQAESSICTTPLHQNEAFLRQKYSVEKLSARQIGVLIGCSHSSVNRALDKYGIRKEERAPGAPPYGFKLENGIVAPHVREQKIIRQIRNMNSRGKTPHAIACYLTEKGFKAPSGKRTWYGNVIREILKRIKKEPAFYKVGSVIKK